jgi:hypothetical protein
VSEEEPSIGRPADVPHIIKERASLALVGVTCASDLTAGVF